MILARQRALHIITGDHLIMPSVRTYIHCHWMHFQSEYSCSIITIYTIILLKSVCLSLFANYRSQFLLDHLWRYLKLFVSQFDLAKKFNRPKTTKTEHRHSVTRVFSWSPATRLNGDNYGKLIVDRQWNGDNRCHCNDTLSQNGETAIEHNSE